VPKTERVPHALDQQRLVALSQPSRQRIAEHVEPDVRVSVVQRHSRNACAAVRDHGGAASSMTTAIVPANPIARAHLEGPTCAVRDSTLQRTVPRPRPDLRVAFDAASETPIGDVHSGTARVHLFV
jgi:hypothetical protein